MPRRLDLAGLGLLSPLLLVLLVAFLLPVAALVPVSLRPYVAGEGIGGPGVEEAWHREIIERPREARPIPDQLPLQRGRERRAVARQPPRAQARRQWTLPAFPGVDERAHPLSEFAHPGGHLREIVIRNRIGLRAARDQRLDAPRGGAGRCYFFAMSSASAMRFLIVSASCPWESTRSDLAASSASSSASLL